MYAYGLHSSSLFCIILVTNGIIVLKIHTHMQRKCVLLQPMTFVWNILYSVRICTLHSMLLFVIYPINHGLLYIFIVWCLIKHRICLHGVVLHLAQGHLHLSFNFLF